MSKSLLQKLGYVPRTGVWEITLRCNLNCLHCGSRAGLARGEELSTAEALDLVDQLVELGLPFLTLSGGEPLLRKDWPQITRRFVDQGVTVNLISNGLLCDERALDLARESGLKNFVFSYDGEETIHDHIRNLPGVYKRLLQSIELCQRENFPVSVVSHVNRLNFPLLNQMYEHLKGLGVFAWQLQPGIPMGNYLDHPELILKPDDFLYVIPALADLFEHAAQEGVIEMYAADGIGYFGAPEEKLRKNTTLGFWYGCCAGCQVIGIEANGNIKPCLTMQDPNFVVGNIRQQSLREIWEKDENFAFNRLFEVEQLEGFCKTCRYGDICRAGCRWQAYTSSGSLFENRYCYYKLAHLAGLEE